MEKATACMDTMSVSESDNWHVRLEGIDLALCKCIQVARSFEPLIGHATQFSRMTPAGLQDLGQNCGAISNVSENEGANAEGKTKLVHQSDSNYR